MDIEDDNNSMRGLDIGEILSRTDIPPNKKAETKPEEEDKNPEGDEASEEGDEKPKKAEKPKEDKPEQKSKEKDDDDDGDDEEEDDKPAKQEDKKSVKDDQDYRNLEKRHKDAQKWGNELSKKLSGYEKAIKKFTDEGTLTDDEAKELLDHTKHEVSQEAEPDLVRYSKLWDEGIDHMLEYADDPKQIDQYVFAFQQLLREDQQGVMDVFDDIDKTPSAFAKKLVQMGKKYNDEVFDEVYKAGSIGNYKKIKNQEIEELKEKLDKAHKRIERYKKQIEDYDTDSPMNLPSGMSSVSPAKKKYSSNVEDILSM